MLPLINLSPQSPTHRDGEVRSLTSRLPPSPALVQHSPARLSNRARRWWLLSSCRRSHSWAISNLVYSISVFFQKTQTANIKR